MTSALLDRRTPPRFERRIILLSSALALLALIFGIGLLWTLPLAMLVRGLIALALLVVLGVLWASLRTAVVDPLRGLTNVVEAYRSGDYTIRSSRAVADDALGDLVHEINSLGNTLHEQRLLAMEASALLDKLIAAIDVAILAFDGEGQLRLFNPAALQLLGLTAEKAVGKSAADLGLRHLFVKGSHSQIVTTIAGRSGRWQVTHGTFRESGLSQHLLIVADVQQALREEERSAWQRLIRVISHEVNNSLAPIKSLAATLEEMLAETLAAGPFREEALPALRLIGDRTDSLQRFLAQHSRLARLHAPQRRWFAAGSLLARVARLEHVRPIEIEAAEGLQVFADEDQLEQALINLVKNAIEAQDNANGTIRITASDDHDRFILTVTDEGPGITNPDNLFVPFFTTKPGGSGIGLALSRQIAEAHDGTLRLENRAGGKGAIATLEIPGAVRHLQMSG